MTCAQTVPCVEGLSGGRFTALSLSEAGVRSWTCRISKSSRPGRSEVSVGVQRGARIVGLIPGRSFEASQAPSPSEVIKNTCDHPDALVLRFRSLSIISHQSQFRPFSLFFLYYFTAKAPCSGNGIRKCKFRLAYAQLCNVCGNFHFLGVVQYGLRVLR